MEPNPEVDDLCPFSEYVAKRPIFFPSPSSAEWTVRKHKDELARCGALLIVAGRRIVNGRKFDDAIVSIGQREARQADKYSIGNVL